MPKSTVQTSRFLNNFYRQNPKVVPAHPNQNCEYGKVGQHTMDSDYHSHPNSSDCYYSNPKQPAQRSYAQPNELRRVNPTINPKTGKADYDRAAGVEYYKSHEIFHEAQFQKGLITPLAQTKNVEARECVMKQGECVIRPHGQHIKHKLSGTPIDQQLTNISQLAYIEIPWFDGDSSGSVDMHEYVEKLMLFFTDNEIVNEDTKLWIMSQRLRGYAYDNYVAWESDHYTRRKSVTLLGALRNLKKLVYRQESIQNESKDYVKKIKINCWSESKLIQRCPFIGKYRAQIIMEMREDKYINKETFEVDFKIDALMSRREMEVLGPRLDFSLPKTSISSTTQPHVPSPDHSLKPQQLETNCESFHPNSEPDEPCPVSNNSCLDSQSSIIDPRVGDSGYVEKEGDRDQQNKIEESEAGSDLPQGTSLPQAEPKPWSETAHVELVSPSSVKISTETVRSQKKKRGIRNRKRTSKRPVPGNEYGETPTTFIETQIFYKGGKGIPIRESQIPIRTQVYYRSKQPYKLPSRVFWQSKETRLHNKGKWLAGPGYLKDMLKGKADPVLASQIDRVENPDLGRKLLKNELEVLNNLDSVSEAGTLPRSRFRPASTPIVTNKPLVSSPSHVKTPPVTYQNDVPKWTSTPVRQIKEETKGVLPISMLVHEHISGLVSSSIISDRAGATPDVIDIAQVEQDLTLEVEEQEKPKRTSPQKSTLSEDRGLSLVISQTLPLADLPRGPNIHLIPYSIGVTPTEQYLGAEDREQPEVVSPPNSTKSGDRGNTQVTSKILPLQDMTAKSNGGRHNFNIRGQPKFPQNIRLPRARSPKRHKLSLGEQKKQCKREFPSPPKHYQQGEGHGYYDKEPRFPPRGRGRERSPGECNIRSLDFDGQGSWSTFERKFLSFIRNNKITDEQAKLSQLSLSLQGKASDFYETKVGRLESQRMDITLYLVLKILRNRYERED